MLKGAGQMMIGYGGNVSFKVDNAYDINDTKNKKPSQELREMTRAWLRYLKSIAGDHIFFNNPYDESEGRNRYQARVKMYKKYGFSEPVLDSFGMREKYKRR